MSGGDVDVDWDVDREVDWDAGVGGRGLVSIPSMIPMTPLPRRTPSIANFHDVKLIPLKRVGRGVSTVCKSGVVRMFVEFEEFVLFVELSDMGVGWAHNLLER